MWGGLLSALLIFDFFGIQKRRTRVSAPHEDAVCNTLI